MRSPDVFVVKYGSAYRYRAGEWTRSQRLADRFASRSDAWEVIITTVRQSAWRSLRVVRLRPRRCRCCA